MEVIDKRNNEITIALNAHELATIVSALSYVPISRLQQAFSEFLHAHGLDKDLSRDETLYHAFVNANISYKNQAAIAFGD